MPDEHSKFPPGSLRPNGEDKTQDEDEVSLIDLLLVVARYKRLIGVTTMVFFVVGLLIALFAPDQYRSSAKVIREIQGEDALGNISALSALRGFGFSLGAVSSGLTPEAYPDITKGREVTLAVVRDTFFFRDVGEEMTFVTYVRDHQGFIRKLAKLPRKLMSAISGADPTHAIRSFDDSIIYLTEEEEQAIKYVSDLVSTNVDLESGLMTIAATTDNPYLSAAVTASFVRHLIDRVREILTYKSRMNLEFIEERFQEAGRELLVAEENLARFLDRNTALKSATLGTERDRLQRQVTFKTQLYSDLQAQLTQAEIELQRSEPVVTILERPAPPIEPAGMSGKVILIVFLLLGAAVGVALAFIRWSLDQQMTDEEERAKMDEVREALVPKRLSRVRFPRLWQRKSATDAAGQEGSL